VLADVRQRLGSGFGAPGETIMLLGRTAAELGGSLWAHVVHGHLGGRPPAVDLAAEQRLAAVLAAGAAARLLSAAHDLSDGGLALALAEACLTGGTGEAGVRAGGGVGARVSGPAADPFSWLFSESAGRAIVAVRPGSEAEFTGLCAGHVVPAAAIGTTGGQALEVSGLFSVPLTELGEVYRRTFPALFG